MKKQPLFATDTMFHIFLGGGIYLMFYLKSEWISMNMRIYDLPPPTHTQETSYNIWHILGYHVLSRRAPDIDWLMSRDVAEHSLIPNTPSYNKESWPLMPTLPRLGRTFELSGLMLKKHLKNARSLAYYFDGYND